MGEIRRKLISGTVSLLNPVLHRSEGEYKSVKKLDGGEMILVEKEGKCFIKIPDSVVYLPIVESFDSFE